MLKELKKEENVTQNEEQREEQRETFQAIKSLTVEVNQSGNLRIIPNKMSPDEVTGLLLRVASNIKQQLGL